MPLPVFQFTATTYTPFLYPQGSSGRARINLYATDGNRLYLIFGSTGTNILGFRHQDRSGLLHRCGIRSPHRFAPQ
jgi:hypothetical protein